MRTVKAAPLLVALAAFFVGCGGDGPSSPTSPVPPPVPPAPSYQITTLITVYRNSTSGAFWSRGSTTSERIGQIILGVDDLAASTGSTNLNNEGGRNRLQGAINRIRDQFQAADYPSAFGETEANLERYLNDADQDSWSIDGRNGAGMDWPYDRNGNDPDGWTGQIVVTVERSTN